MANAATFERLQQDMKDAMRARDAARLGTVRMLISSLKNKQIDLRQDLTEDDIVTVLSTEAKKRREAIEAYTKAGRDELAAQEELELGIINDYLPQQLGQEEVIALIDAAIAQTGATSRKEMGKIMGAVMPQTKGRFDGGKLKDLVMSKLS